MGQGWLNSLKVVGAQLTNKTYFYCETETKFILMSTYKFCGGKYPQYPQYPPGSTAYADAWGLKFLRLCQRCGQKI